MSRHYIPKRMTKKKYSLQQKYLAAALLLVVLVGTSMWTSAALAKYASTASGTSHASVAAFVVEAAGDDSQSLKLDTTNNTASYDFKVSNNKDGAVGEVTTAYDVTVTFPSALSGVTLTLKNGGEPIDGTTTDNTTYVFKNVGTFAPGEPSTDSLSLNFKLDNGVSSDNTWEDIKIVVNATQKD